MFYYFALYALDTNPCISKGLRDAFAVALVDSRHLEMKRRGVCLPHLPSCLPLKKLRDGLFGSIAIFIFVPHFQLVLFFIVCLFRCYYFGFCFKGGRE